LTTNYVLCRKSTDLSWEEDEPSAVVAEEGSTPAAEESGPLPQAETVVPAVEATLPEASMVEGEYTTQTQSSSKSSRSPRETNPMCLLLTGTEAEGNTIPEAVPVEGLVPETREAARAAPEPAEVASGEVPEMAAEKRDEALPDSSLEVVVRSPEIRDAEPIRSAPMSGTATSSRGGIELLADDLVDPAAVARNLEAMHRAQQWMKVSYQYP
jgi:hypothetical protein